MSDENTPYALVVDDDGLIRMDAVDILEEAGFRVLEAANAEEALLVLQKHGEDIQLLFTDVQMPPRRVERLPPRSAMLRILAAHRDNRRIRHDRTERARHATRGQIREEAI